jgi:hypothetical protein
MAERLTDWLNGLQDVMADLMTARLARFDD